MIRNRDLRHKIWWDFNTARMEKDLNYLKKLQEDELRKNKAYRILNPKPKRKSKRKITNPVWDDSLPE